MLLGGTWESPRDVSGSERSDVPCRLSANMASSLRPLSTQVAVTRPPKPRLVFRVGVVGHRPNRLQSANLSALSTRLGFLLDTVRTQVEASGRQHGRLLTV